MAYDLSEGVGGEGVPLFLQWDKRWGYERYGSDYLAITGCGPTCLAMAGYYLTGDASFDPALVAAALPPGCPAPLQEIWKDHAADLSDHGQRSERKLKAMR
jgi:hypothetical protein